MTGFSRLRLGAPVTVSVLLATLVAGALAASPPARLVGSPAAGKPLFEAYCSTCHTLKAAGTKGTTGPNLDALVLPESTIVAELDKGGSSLMGRAGARYMTQMMAYKGILTASQIRDVAAFEYAATHP